MGTLGRRRFFPAGTNFGWAAAFERGGWGEEVASRVPSRRRHSAVVHHVPLLLRRRRGGGGVASRILLQLFQIGAVVVDPSELELLLKLGGDGDRLLRRLRREDVEKRSAFAARTAESDP